MLNSQDIKTAWDLSSLFKDMADPSIDSEIIQIAENVEKFVNKWSSRSDYLSDPAVLLIALREYEDLLEGKGISGNAGYYLSLLSTLDQSNTELKGRLNKIEEKAIKMSNDLLFFSLNLAKVPVEVQEIMLASAGLLPYKHYLQKLFDEAKFTLTEKEEKLISLLSPSAFENWVSMTSDLISREEMVIDGKKLPISEGIRKMDSTIKEERETAAKEVNRIMGIFAPIAEAEMNSIMQAKKSLDALRGFKRPDQARILSDDLETTVVDSLIEAVSSRNDISREYYSFKAKLFGKDTIEYHERNVPYVGNSKEIKYSFENAVGLVDEVYGSTDAEFKEIFNKYVSEGHIDVYPAKGKTSGAFCASGDLRQPGFVLLNFVGDMTDVLTIAHEMGHAINNELMRKKESGLNFESPLCLAEVASTFMEELTLDRLMETVDDETRLTLLVKRIEESVVSITRQIACYRFEQELHEKFAEVGYVSKEDIGIIFIKHMKDYLGDAVNIYDGIQNWWVYWSHIRDFFYVYSYASGLLISKALYSKYKESPEYIEKIKIFLATGISSSPVEIFKSAGIDISEPQFWKDGLLQVERELNEAKDLAKKLGEI